MYGPNSVCMLIGRYLCMYYTRSCVLSTSLIGDCLYFLNHKASSWDSTDKKILDNFYRGQLNSEWIHEVIVSTKMPTKIFPDFCPTKQARIIALFGGDFLVSVGSFFGYDPWLVGRAEILVILGLHFGRNDDLINSFWI